MLKPMRTLLVALLLPALPAGAAEMDKVLQPFIAHYQGRASGLTVSDLGVRELKSLGDGQYQLQYRADAMIYSLEETSVFRTQDEQIQPLTYNSSRGSFFSKRDVSMDFDWNKMQAKFDYKGRLGKFKLEPNTQDPLSGSLELARILTADKQFIEYRAAEKKGIGTTKMELIDQPELKSEVGNVKTWHLRRVHGNDYRSTEIWLLHDYPTIPVKVIQVEKGDEFQLDLTKFELK